MKEPQGRISERIEGLCTVVEVKEGGEWNDVIEVNDFFRSKVYTETLTKSQHPTGT